MWKNENQGSEKKDDRKNITLRLPPDLHKKAKVKAAQEGRSLQDVLEELTQEWLRNNQQENR
jgi:predicted HicB family RNase H-like nuclease